MADGRIDSRRAALEDLEEAARRGSDRADLQQALSRTYASTGHLALARKCLERLARLTPEDAGAQFGLGLSWKWDWLASLDESSYSRAVECMMRAARLSPRALDARLALAALALAKGNLALGTLAARSAVVCDPASPEALLAFAWASYRAGSPGLADSAFRVAIPLLPAESRRRFTDLSVVAGADAPDSSDGGEASALPGGPFWKWRDPDLTTPENEAELNYFSRIASALLLLRDEKGVRWDARAELIARYGLPEAVQLHPPDAVLEFSVKRMVKNEYAPDPLTFPYNEQIWSYPDLGLRAVLWDQSLRQTYQFPVAYEDYPDPRPDPAVLAQHPELIPLGNGLGVLRALPPGVAPMNARALLSRFPADSGARLVASLEAPGGPADSLTGSWVVVAADGRVVARGSGALSISACDPAARRLVDLEAEVPPGDYRVDLAVSDGRSRRGLVHLRSAVAPSSSRLSLSDLVLLCGPEAAGSAGSSVRIEPNFERRVGHARAVALYFEVDHLAPGPGGQSRFAYTYALRPAGGESADRPGPERVFEASREEEFRGARRRQFVSAPLQSLKRGAYDFEIEVRDLVSGDSVSGAVRFTKD